MSKQKKHYECVQFNVISFMRGGCQFSRKKALRKPYRKI